VKSDAQPVILGAMFGHPLVHNLRIAQLTELAEELLGQTAHFMPGRIGIDFPHHRGNGPAAPDGHPQIMHGVFIGGIAELLEFSWTRSIQCVRPRCSAGAPGMAVTVAMRASEDVRYRSGCGPNRTYTTAYNPGWAASTPGLWKT